MALTACRIFYEGGVQGVGFRYTVKQIASGYDVAGWVRNLPDGRVELQAQRRGGGSARHSLKRIARANWVRTSRAAKEHDGSRPAARRGF